MVLAASLFGPIDTIIGPQIEHVLFVLAVVNVIARAVGHRTVVRQAESGGAEAIKRHPVLLGTNLLLILGVFYYTTLEYHAGIVISTLVLGMALTDFFEFESRKVEARQELPIERPKGAIVASLLVVLYAGYLSVFFLIQPYWSQIV
ncbi:DUF7313 family protein [Halocatena pleomorpha]|uniref:DUF7313 domain-containing protein n=1 Tax=Halocatena pleomorpha TaxID=1785090 RepID=A0A3P3RK69_9EURY|nr:hypothetical protein [Halocatena pleomorpha]RRJ32823.1 hypothetical protein EIK79_03970 [Halocatena pleomorpha]